MGLNRNSVAKLMGKREAENGVQLSTYAFMPAVLEVQETPPSPIGRAIIWTISLLFVIAIVWGVIGKMDVVAVAQGKIIPGGRVKTVQPLEIGKVEVIHVVEGQAVNAGEPLITLDSTVTQADADQLQQQLKTAQLNAIRQQQFQLLLDAEQLSNSRRDEVKEAFLYLEGATPGEIHAQYRLLIQQVKEYQSRELNLQSELTRREAEQQRARATLTKLARTLPLVTERVQSLEKLMHKQMAARDQYLELEQARIEQEQDLIALEAQSLELSAAVQSIQAQLNALRAEVQKNNLLEWSQTEQQIAALQQELIKVRQRNEQQVIRSPIDGTVQQLAIHTVGGVVTPAQALMQIVPKNSVLEVEAMILNKDIGFVEEGQRAEVKVDAFNFTKYGTVEANIETLSSDAISNDKLGLVYLAKVFIKQTQMRVNKRLVNLSPGMSVTVEVKTGKRRIVEYFLSPLLRYKQESIRER